MKNKLFATLLLATAMTFTCACAQETVTSVSGNTYEEQMSSFFDNLVTLNDEINALDPDDADSVDTLFSYLSEMEEQYKELSEIEVPEEYIATESLADEAYTYMQKANEYFTAAFDEEGTYNQSTYDAAIECYNRANKRVQYIIDLIHGELPDDANVTIE